MKLLNSQLSPFAARVRFAIYARSLPVEIVPANLWAAPGQKNPEYLAINPIGKVPTLVLADDSALPEAETIVEYLADAFPAAQLRPGTPQAIARGRLLARIFEQYVLIPSWSTLFANVFAPARDDAALDAAVAKIDEGLGHLEHFMPGDTWAVGESLTTADCLLLPALFFQALLIRRFERPDPMDRHAKLAAYYARASQDAVSQRVFGEMLEGIKNSRMSTLLAVTAS